MSVPKERLNETDFKVIAVPLFVTSVSLPVEGTCLYPLSCIL